MAFPETSVLDSFDRSNEGPPPSASWRSDSARAGFSTLSVSSNQCVSSGGDGGLWGTAVGPETELFTTIADIAANGAQTQFFLRANDVGNTSTVTGYELRWFRADASTGTQYQFYRWDTGGVQTDLGAFGTESGGSWSNGIKFGVSMVGSTLTLYVNRGSWSQIDTRSDSTYNSSGYIGLRLSGSTATKYDDFGGGTIPASGNTYTKSGLGVIG